MCILGDDAGGFGSSGFTVQWIYAGIVAYLYLLYEGARIRYPLLSFSCQCRRVDGLPVAAAICEPLWI